MPDIKGRTVDLADVSPGRTIKKKPKALAEPWWMQKKEDELGQAVKLTVDRWYEQHEPRRMEYHTLTEQYEGAAIGALSPTDYAPEGKRDGSLRYNVMRSTVDTLTSRYSKEKPRPVVQTEKGKWRHKRHAREMNKLLYGVLQQNGVYRKGRQVFRDAALLQMGGFKTSVNPMTLDIEIEKTAPDEWLWDLADAFRGDPSELAHLVARPRYTVMAKWPKKAKAIAEASPSRDFRPGERHTADLVDVVEMWKLPSYPGAKDGRRVLAVDDIVLADEPWEFDRFPFSRMVFSQSFRGFSGNGVGSILMGFQLTLNNHLRADEEAMERGSKLRCFVFGDDGEAQISKLESDVNGGIYHVKNVQNQPVFDPGRSLDPAKVEYDRWIVQSCYDAVGLSQLSATGQKPAGLDAAVAMREMQDIEALRFMETQAEYEELFIDLAKMIMLYANKYWKGKGKSLKVKGKGFIETVDFDAIDLPEDAYDIGVYASSMLPKQPGARQQRLQEMVQNRIISIPQMMVLMDMPDIEGEAELRSAPLTYIDWLIGRFLEEDPPSERKREPAVKEALDDLKNIEDADERAQIREQIYADLLYIEPDGTEALEEGITRMQNAYALARRTDISPQRLGLLTQWIKDAKDLLAQAAMAGQANAIGAGPSGTPGAMGTSVEPAPAVTPLSQVTGQGV